MWCFLNAVPSAVAAGDIIDLSWMQQGQSNPVLELFNYVAPAGPSQQQIPIISSMSYREGVANPIWGLPEQIFGGLDDIRLAFTPAAPVAQTLGVHGRFVDLPV